MASCELTKGYINKVLLAKELKGVGFSRKSIFNNLIKAGKFDKFLVQHEEQLQDIKEKVKIDLRAYVKKHKKTMAKEEIKLIEEKQRKELEKLKREAEEETSGSEEENETPSNKNKIPPPVSKSIYEDIESDQEPSRRQTQEESKDEKIYNLENDNESLKEEIEFLKNQLKERDEEIVKLKKRNFTLKRKLEAKLKA